MATEAQYVRVMVMQTRFAALARFYKLQKAIIMLPGETEELQMLSNWYHSLGTTQIKQLEDMAKEIAGQIHNMEYVLKSGKAHGN